METPNYVGAYVNALEAGRSQARRKGVENALARYKTDPQGAQDDLMRYGAVGEAGAIEKLRERQRQEALRAKVAPKVQAGDYTGARQEATAGGDFDMAKTLGDMDEDRLKKVDKTNSILGGVAHYLGSVEDPQQRAQLWQQTAPMLVQQGVLTPEQIQGVDLSNDGLKKYEVQALSVKEQIDLQLRQRQAALEAERVAETKRSNRAREGISAGQLGVARGNLGVRQQEFSARKNAGGFGTPGVGAVIGPNLTEDWEVER